MVNILTISRKNVNILTKKEGKVKKEGDMTLK